MSLHAVIWLTPSEACDRSGAGSLSPDRCATFFYRKLAIRAPGLTGAQVVSKPTGTGYQIVVDRLHGRLIGRAPRGLPRWPRVPPWLASPRRKWRELPTSRGELGISRQSPVRFRHRRGDGAADRQDRAAVIILAGPCQGETPSPATLTLTLTITLPSYPNHSAAKPPPILTRTRTQALTRTRTLT